MKITHKYEDKGQTFKSLKKGDIFFYNKNYFMKTEEIKNGFNAVWVYPNSGSHCMFGNSEEEVLKLEVELIVQ